jgi:hypothetical protein
MTERWHSPDEEVICLDGVDEARVLRSQRVLVDGGEELWSCGVQAGDSAIAMAMVK